VGLHPRAIEILLLLVRQSSRVVATKRLAAEVWPTQRISGKTVQLHVNALCQALGNPGRGGHAGYVTEVSGRGYRFAVPIVHTTLPSSADSAPPAPGRWSPFAPDDERLQRVLEFAEANLERKITVKDLAAIAGLSSFHFSRAFRRSTGTTPRRFVRDRRLELAKALLISGTLPLVEIALSCSFSSQASFTRAFSNALGTSPGKYRSRHGRSERLRPIARSSVAQERLRQDAKCHDNLPSECGGRRAI
jgi:AraC-like DNA-binding protein